MSLTAENLINVSFLTLLLSSIYLWIQLALGRLPRWRPILHVEPQLPTPWALVDLIIAFMLIAGIMELAKAWTLRGTELGPDFDLTQQPLDIQLNFLWASSGAKFLGTLLALAWTVRRYPQGPERLLGSLAPWRNDLLLGVVGFLLFVPPILVLQVALTQLFPSKHPLIELVLETKDARILWASGVAAVVVAPLVEEFQFRVLFQGWLQLVARRDIPFERWIYGILVPVPSTDSPAPASERPRRDPLDVPRVPARWPTVVSALFFAGAHLSHGPDPLPLLFLALGLGWMYRGTGRILPGITVHFLLNLWTLFVLLANVYGGPEP
ncbi:MAG: CPBP family glutamic-type intramembrane protease [Pirellulales bacterium]